MIRKAFILGAGLGTRLRPLTNVRPKPLIPLFRRPMVQYAMDRALELGIHDIAVNTHHLAEVWDEYFPVAGGESFQGKNGIASKVSIYKEASVNLFSEPELLETGGGICNVSDWIGDEDALVYNGDIYCSIPLQPLVDLHNKGDYEATLILRSNGPACHIAIEGDAVVDIHNKLGKAEGAYQFTGIYAIKGKISERLEPNKKESIIRVFLELAAEGKLGAVVVDEGEWFDLGTREMYLQAHASETMMPTGIKRVAPSAEVSESATVENSWVSSEVKIGEDAVIEGSVIWNGAKVGAGAKVVNSIVFSDVQDGACLENTDH